MQTVVWTKLVGRVLVSIGIGRTRGLRATVNSESCTAKGCGRRMQAAVDFSGRVSLRCLF